MKEDIQIETGKRTGRAGVLSAIAKALDVSLEQVTKAKHKQPGGCSMGGRACIRGIGGNLNISK